VADAGWQGGTPSWITKHPPPVNARSAGDQVRAMLLLLLLLLLLQPPLPLTLAPPGTR